MKSKGSNWENLTIQLELKRLIIYKNKIHKGSEFWLNYSSWFNDKVSSTNF